MLANSLQQAKPEDSLCVTQRGHGALRQRTKIQALKPNFWTTQLDYAAIGKRDFFKYPIDMQLALASAGVFISARNRIETLQLHAVGWFRVGTAMRILTGNRQPYQLLKQRSTAVIGCIPAPCLNVALHAILCEEGWA